MAASTRSVWGCPSRLLCKLVFNSRSYPHCTRKFHIISYSEACFQCKDAPVVAAIGRLNVTFAGQIGRRFHAHARVVSCEQPPGTVFSSAQFSRPSSTSALLNRYVFPNKNNFWKKRTVRCRMLCLRTPPDQSESETQSVSTRHKNGFSSGHSNISSSEEKTHDRATCRSEGPEKKENIKTIPNLLTTLRMASAPLLGYLVVCESFGPALGIFTFAGISDMLDGYIARNFPNQTSALGSALDPLADKLLVTILTVSLTSVGLIPLPLTGLIVFRDVSLIAGGFYIRYKSLPPPITMSRYFDISHATVSLAPTFISKVNTGLQLSLVAFSLAAPVFGFVDHVLLQVLWWTTGATTFLSGADYLWSWKKYVTLLEKDQKEL
ncbi:cardiolipin synthase (CMP-forming)-like [Babylonia areolata]|uniref:cardiolipin synthase (CMP-forming)-like n=1 Tax=Babylonia areolata TaxID=304850 RepID=UPI003FD0C8EE